MICPRLRVDKIEAGARQEVSTGPVGIIAFHGDDVLTLIFNRDSRDLRAMGCGGKLNWIVAGDGMRFARGGGS